MNNTTLQTLAAIEKLGDISAADLATHLKISPAGLSNRTRKLFEEKLIQKRRYGKEARFYLTDLGKLYLNNSKAESHNPPLNAQLMLKLEQLLEKSFDDTYQLIDLFFERPMLSIITDYSQKNFYGFSEIFELYLDLFNYIHQAIIQQYTSKQFFDHLIMAGEYSHELKGLLYYIANKYNTFADKISNDSIKKGDRLSADLDPDI